MFQLQTWEQTHKYASFLLLFCDSHPFSSIAATAYSATVLTLCLIHFFFNYGRLWHGF
jgi:hypothetical protein